MEGDFPLLSPNPKPVEKKPAPLTPPSHGRNLRTASERKRTQRSIDAETEASEPRRIKKKYSSDLKPPVAQRIKSEFKLEPGNAAAKNRATSGSSSGKEAKKVGFGLESAAPAHKQQRTDYKRELEEHDALLQKLRENDEGSRLTGAKKKIQRQKSSSAVKPPSQSQPRSRRPPQKRPPHQRRPPNQSQTPSQKPSSIQRPPQPIESDDSEATDISLELAAYINEEDESPGLPGELGLLPAGKYWPSEKLGSSWDNYHREESPVFSLDDRFVLTPQDTRSDHLPKVESQERTPNKKISHGFANRER